MLKTERRGSGRIRLRLPLIYANLSTRHPSSYRYYRTAIGDLSQRGLGITLDEPLRPKDLLQVVLTIPIKPFVLTGLCEAMWAQRLAGTSQHRAGLHFVNISRKQGEALAALMP